jgi:aminopeptidase N
MFKKFLGLLLLAVLFTACGRGNPPADVVGELAEAIHTGTGTTEIPGGGEEDEPLPEPLPVAIPPHNEYIITLDIDPDARTVQGISRITFTNRTEVPLDEIVLRVYLNAFREGAEAPVFSEFERRVFPHGPDYGYMEIQFVSLNDEPLEYVLDGTVLTLIPTEPLPPETTVQLYLQYNATIPMIAHRTGANEQAIWFGMFLPVLSVYGENGWHVEPYFPAGDPFILETANYQVDITTPIRYVVAGTGHKTEHTIEDTDTKITHFTAPMTRDFAFVISPYFNHAHTVTENGVDIHFYYYSEDIREDETMDLSRRSMEYFHNMVGIYPFGHVTIVETDIMINAMAFSQLVLVDSRHLRHGDLWALAHSLGDQWFFNVVGSNRIAEPWLDEGLPRFVQAGIFYETPEDLRGRMEREYDTIYDRDDLYISDGLWAYTNWMHYAQAQGRKVMLMLYSLQSLMGDESFWSFINQYYQAYSFRIATGADFIRLAEEAYGDCLNSFFEQWINRGTVPSLPPWD